MEMHQVKVALITGDDGADRVAIDVVGSLDHMMALTPAQARMLATDLITAVNRAEVKVSLKTSPNMWRRGGTAQPRGAEAPAYQGEPLPRLATAG
ncbi:MAG TPA: hypothetical protein PLL19_03105 [Thiobacillaceae bacterium]|nr:hypothetical protein [Thiobacillaceae bacterium]HNI08073.1 hypothetical protein [Thiobacillaceae bacterium]